MRHQLLFLFQDFKAFVRKDFNIAAYTYTFVLSGLSILLIYGTDIGKSISSNQTPTSNNLINNILMFVLIYFLVAIPTLIIKQQFQKLRQPAFYLKALLLVCIIGFADAFSWKDALTLPGFTQLEKSFIFKTLWRMRNAIFVLPILIMLRIFVDRKVPGLYGISRGSHHIRAYLSLYIVILPVLVLVSFTPDFLSYYPSYDPWLYGQVFGFPAWLNTIIYETVYMSDFLMVELIFRGALVIGMGVILERESVLPMCAVYVALHFGKPVLETTSAMFGGYFLGAIAYQTRHIWGGIIIHMGIALIIELLRFLQHYTLGIG